MGPRSVALDLAAQVADVDPQYMGLFHIPHSPDLLEDLTVGQHLTGVGHQQAQQIVLGGGQLHLFPAHHHPTPGEIHRQFMYSVMNPPTAGPVIGAIAKLYDIGAGTNEIRRYLIGRELIES